MKTHWYVVCSIRRCIISYVPVTSYSIIRSYLVCDFIPDHHRGSPEIATTKTITIGVINRLQQYEQRARRPAQGDHVAAVPYDSLHLLFGHHIYQGWPLLRGRPKQLLTLRVTTGKRPFGKLIRNYLRILSGNFAAIPQGMKRRILY